MGDYEIERAERREAAIDKMELRRDRGSWMQTFTGRRFFPMDPDPDEVDVLDVAHSLAMQCRYNGHVRSFYCPTPDQRVLTADLRWVPAGELTVGDDLLAFDEHPVELGQAGKRRRRFRASVVTHAEMVRREVYRVIMSDDSRVLSSGEHPWLLRAKAAGNQHWRKTTDIAAALTGDHPQYINRFMEPWATDITRDGGWLAGILDGEGHISLLRQGVQFGVAQNPGLVLDEIEKQFQRLGFKHTASRVGNCEVRSLDVLGGWREMARLLGTTRPLRLLKKFETGLFQGAFDKQFNSTGKPLEIVAVEHVGDEWVAGLETSTHTYICEGFGAHNSVAEHCVLVSRVVAPEHALWGLLHDATEAYVGDMVRPLKVHMPAYRAAEDRVMDAIATRYGLVGPMPSEVKEADTRLLLDERDALLGPSPARWDVDGEPFGVRIEAWSPERAEAAYLSRFSELTGRRP